MEHYLFSIYHALIYFLSYFDLYIGFLKEIGTTHNSVKMSEWKINVSEFRPRKMTR